MFKGGSVWRPPPINPWTQGMPDELIEMEERQEPRRGSLSNRCYKYCSSLLILFMIIKILFQHFVIFIFIANEIDWKIYYAIYRLKG